MPEAREWSAVAEELRPIIVEHAAAADLAGEPRDEVMHALAESGLLRLGLPVAYGGAEVEPRTLVQVVEAIAAMDGSAGWLTAINIMGALTMARVERRVVDEIYAEPGVSTAGVFAPTAMAEVSADAYRLTGRWTFASNSRHAGWFLCGTVLVEDGAMVTAGGRPVVRMLAFPAADVRIHSTWDTLGLRGTGSHDIEVQESLVPKARSLSLVDPGLVADEPLYRMPYFGMSATLMAAVAMGIARGAVAHATKVAAEKTPLGSRKAVLERPYAQTMIIDARTTLDTAGAHLASCRDLAWANAQAGEVDMQERAELRLAACNAVTASVRAVDLAHHVVGSSSVFRSSPLERALRDVFTLRQHVMVGPSLMDVATRSRLGIRVDTTML